MVKRPSLGNGGKSKTGGLTAKGRRMEQRNGHNLKRPTSSGPRHKSFCARMRGVKGPMMRNGKPTRKALALRKWKC